MKSIALILSLIAVGLPSSSTDSAKCPAALTAPGYPDDVPVVLYGDSILPAETGLYDLNSLPIGATRVDCWNPETGSFGARSGIPVLRVIPGRHWDELHASLTELMQAQAAVKVRNGAYEARADELISDPWPLSRVVISVTREGWSAAVETGMTRCTIDHQTTEITWGEECSWRDGVQAEAMRRLVSGR